MFVMVCFFPVIIGRMPRSSCKLIRYDLNTRKLITSPEGTDFPWETNLKTNNPPSFLYFGRFDYVSNRYILTGGCNGNEVKLFDITSKHYATFSGFEREVVCGSFSRDNSTIALGSVDGFVRMYNVNLV